MWPRVVEFMLACWLAMSPFVFGHAAGATALWATDFGAATLIAGFALLSFHPRLRRLHLAELGVSAWLMGAGWMWSDPVHAAPAYQNWICVGFLLWMFAIIPSRADRPPKGWEEYRRRRAEGGEVPGEQEPGRAAGVELTEEEAPFPEEATPGPRARRGRRH